MVVWGFITLFFVGFPSVHGCGGMLVRVIDFIVVCGVISLLCRSSFLMKLVFGKAFEGVGKPSQITFGLR